MTNLSLLTSKSGLNDQSLVSQERSATTGLIGDARDASNVAYVGKVWTFQYDAGHVAFLPHTQVALGTVTNTIKKPTPRAATTKYTSRCRRNSRMKFKDILEEFTKLSQKRSAILKDVNDMEDEVMSISERIVDLQDANPQTSDEIVKAKDKRKRVRSDISQRKHDVRLVEAEIDALKMRFKWLVDYEATNEQD